MIRVNKFYSRIGDILRDEGPKGGDDISMGADPQDVHIMKELNSSSHAKTGVKVDIGRGGGGNIYAQDIVTVAAMSTRFLIFQYCSVTPINYNTSIFIIAITDQPNFTSACY